MALSTALPKWGEVDYLVVGDSPGGLWLLSQLAQWISGPVKLGHCKGKGAGRPVWVNYVLTERFGLKAVTKKKLELLWPTDGMRWEKQTLTERFPKISTDFLFASDGLFAPGAKQWGNRAFDPKAKKFLDDVLAQYPELLGAAQSLWRVFGKSDSVANEVLLWNLLACLDLQEWEPEREVPLETERFLCSDLAAQLTGITNTSDGAWELGIADKGALVAKHVIFALSSQEMKRLRPLLSSLKIDVVPKLDAKANFKLSIDLQKGTLPAPMCDLCIVLDSWEIPEPETEVWPFERVSFEAGEGVKAWVTSESDPSLDSISERYQQAVKRFQELVPFSKQRIKSYRPGLHWEECREDEARANAVAAVESTMHERFSLSLMEPRTRYKNLFLVGPYFFTHWPYPMGELWAAQSLKSYLVPAKRKKEKQPVPTSASASGGPP